MDRMTLFEEYRLIERSESEVNGAWKGAHLLLLFLAFVFGSFCTFCFHMLMYLFDEKCVLFPKLLSLTTLRQNIIYEFIPEDKEIADMLPVDFLSTQWIDKSACYLPTYVPLVSGIFGLVWTTMFLMCSTGSRTLTGLQRSWRVLLPVFVFSVAMGGLSLYVTIITQSGLEELCMKLGEITGSSTCSYTVNVVTLAYEKRIRGVYQATRLTILSAWLHTLCWLLSALLTLVRVILVVDFQLVKVSVKLKGNIDMMLENHEEQVRTVSPDLWIYDDSSAKPHESTHSLGSLKVHFQKREQTSRLTDTSGLDDIKSSGSEGQLLFTCPFPKIESNPSLMQEERNRLDRLKVFSSVPKDKQFIVKILYDLIDTIGMPEEPTTSYISPSTEGSLSFTRPLIRQYGQQAISSKTAEGQISKTTIDLEKAEQLILEIKRKLERKYDWRVNDPRTRPSTSKKAKEFDSVTSIKSVLKENLAGKSSENISLKRKLSPSTNRERIVNVEKPKTNLPLKSNLKNKNVQTDKIKTPLPKVHIAESGTSVFSNVYESATDIEPEQKEITKPEKEKKD